MRYIIAYFHAMLPYMLWALSVIIVLRLLWTNQRRKSGERITAGHEAGVMLFFLYLIGLASQAFVSAGYNVDFYAGNFNLIPFRIFSDVGREAVMNHNYEPLLISLAGNIGVFIPMGRFISWLWRKTLRSTLFISFLASPTIEIGQIPLARCSDIRTSG